MRSTLLPLFALIACDPTAPGQAPTPTPDDPTAVPAEIEMGTCEGTGSTYRAAVDTAGEGPVWVEVEPDRRLAVHVDDVGVQCCAEPSGAFAVDGPDVTLDFQADVSTSPCDCYCVYDFVVRSEPLAPGDYHLEVVSGEVALGSFDVVVP